MVSCVASRMPRRKHGLHAPFSLAFRCGLGLRPRKRHAAKSAPRSLCDTVGAFCNRGAAIEPHASTTSGHIVATWGGESAPRGGDGADDVRMATASLHRRSTQRRDVIVSQLQGLFHRFHNEIATDHCDWDFERVQREVRFHYQWMVLNDFLPAIVLERGHRQDVLAERNLLRGFRMRLPSGQAIARAMGIEPLDDDEIRLGNFGNPPEITGTVADVATSRVTVAVLSTPSRCGTPQA